MTMSRTSCALATMALGLLAACYRPAAAAPTMVFAAASLTAPFEELAKAFEIRHPGSNLDLHFAGTPQLVLQVREGATADVFASADAANMQKLVEASQTAAAPQVFARNRLAIAVAKGNPHRIASLADLQQRPGLRVVLCGPEVPAGRYAREALAKAAVTVRSLSDEPSVRAIVSKVRLGEVDAGIVYATDTAHAVDLIGSVAIPDEHNVVTTYPIAMLKAGKSSMMAAQFVAFVLSADGQQILRSFGFQAP